MGVTDPKGGGIVAKRKADLYVTRTVWYKVKNPHYSQAEGEGSSASRGRERHPGGKSHP